MIERSETWEEYRVDQENQDLMTVAQRRMVIEHPHLVFFLPPRRPVLSRVRRLDVFERDGPFCAYCDVELDETTFTIDHIEAFSRGGSDDPENLTVACRSCNSSKGAG